MRLTPVMVRELVLAHLGGDGVYVNPKHPIMQTWRGLERRGLARREDDALAFRSAYFNLTEDGKKIAAELRKASTSAGGDDE